jgi:hypothetical protein
MPGLCDHLVFVSDVGPAARMRGLRRALAWLASGRVLVQYGAGAIEPDAGFARPDDALLGPWAAGTGLLAARAARLGAPIVPAFISGVHSPRAKRLPMVRWAERRGITTVAPLVQATLPGFGDVVVRVRFGAPLPRDALLAPDSAVARTSLVRAAVLALAPALRGS